MTAHVTYDIVLYWMLGCKYDIATGLGRICSKIHKIYNPYIAWPKGKLISGSRYWHAGVEGSNNKHAERKIRVSFNK